MDYHAPTKLDEATALLRTWKGQACVVAGGTNVIPDMRAGKIAPQLLLDISRIEELGGIEERGERIWIGALTSVSQVMESSLVEKDGWILHQTCRRLGNPLVRNRATIGGNLANASPAADTAVPLLALDAMVEIRGHEGRGRHIPLATFFVGPNRTVLEDDEIIKGVLFPKIKSPERTAYDKLGLRNAMAISVASVAVWLMFSEKIFSSVRIALGAVAPTPIRAVEAEQFLGGKEVTPAVLDEAIARVDQAINPISDIRGSVAYRRYVSGVLVRRAIEQALSD
jgi:carbon-monoxide dehydrogenase medium subunit